MSGVRDEIVGGPALVADRNAAVRHAAPWLAMLAALAVFTAGARLAVWRYTPIDDAFISYRYARNLAAGNGAVFNPGERVEGYSSLVWVLALALGDRLGADPPVLSKALGMILGGATLLLFAAAPFGWRTRLAGAALLCVHAPFIYHCVNGLETGLMAFLVTALVVLSLNERAPRAAKPLVAGLLAVARPEGLLCVLVWQLSALAVLGGSFARRMLPASVTGIAVFAAQTAARRAYYGDWIANSARAKMLPLELALPKGLSDLLDFAWQAGGWGVLPLLAVCAAVFGAAGSSGGAAAPSDRRRSLSILLFLLSFALVLATGGGDSFPMWRFLIPLVPLLALSAARGLDAVFGRWRGAGARVGHALAVAAVGAALILPYRSYQSAMDRQRLWTRHWERIGRKLAETFPARTSIALCPVGALPYYSGLAVIDMLGLTDAHIARVEPDGRYYYPGHQRHDAAYVLSRNPDLVMLANGPVTNGVGHRFPWNDVLVYERDVLADERFRRDYGLFHLPLDARTTVGLFARKDFAAAALGGARP